MFYFWGVVIDLEKKFSLGRCIVLGFILELSDIQVNKAVVLYSNN